MHPRRFSSRAPAPSFPLQAVRAYCPTRRGGEKGAVQPFGEEGVWMRCQLHAHTTCSDGELTPAGLAAHYRRAGYDALAVTDHWHRTEAAADGVVVLPSMELNCRLEEDRDGHLLALGVDA